MLVDEAKPSSPTNNYLYIKPTLTGPHLRTNKNAMSDCLVL